MLMSVSGKVMLSKDKHWPKAMSLMLVKPAGKVTFVSFIQPTKLPAGIALSGLALISTLAKYEQFEKAPSPTLVTQAGSAKSVKPDCEKLLAPRLMLAPDALGQSILDKEVSPEKAC